MVLPKPMAGDSLDTRSCSLELDRSRQFARCEMSAAGAPALHTIQLTNRASPDPIIYDRSLVKFAIDLSSAITSHPSPATWRIELVQTPSPRPSPRQLVDGDLIFLWDVKAHRYLRVSSSEGVQHRPDASIFALYKADVADPNRPSTCDDHLPDGDYVYIREIQSSNWVKVSDSVLLPLSPPLPAQDIQPVLPVGASSFAANQTCRTDERGQLLCGWVAHCPSP